MNSQKAVWYQRPQMIETVAIYVLSSIVLGLLLMYFGSFEAFKITHHHIHTVDDHMITLRVAKNFADHGVPFYNIGEPLAANTSLFWPLILGTVLSGTGAFAFLALNVLVSVILSVVTILIATTLVANWVHKISTAILLVGSSSFLTLSSTGWEHVPQMLLLTIGFTMIFHSSSKVLVISNYAMLAICVSFIFRPDSAVIIAVTGIIWFFNNQNFKKILTYVWGLFFLIIPFAYLYLMDMYYNEFFPNTAYLKSLPFMQSIGIGLTYLINPFQAGLVPIILILIIILRPSSSFVKFIILVSLAHMAYVVAIGGDIFANGRFFLILLPVLVPILVSQLASLNFWQNENSTNRVILSSTISLALLSNSLGIAREVYVDQKRASPIEEQVRLLSIAEQYISPNDGSIGLHYLGIGFHFLDFHVVDFLGKAEPHIARTAVKIGPIGHNKWDYDHAFEKYKIAIIPMPDTTVENVLSDNYVITKKSLMFWEICALKALSSGNYEFIPAKIFGNKSYGALLRKDLAKRFISKRVAIANGIK